LLEEGRTLLDDNLLSQARDVLTRLAQQHPGNATNFFQLARADRYRVESYSIRGDNKNAERALDEAIANIQQSLKVNENYAEAHSLLADLYGRKISFGIAMFAGPKYGPTIQAENQRALELDPNNAAAFASRGRQFLESPKMFGGDIDKAVADFRKATQLDPKSDETFVWLAIALRKKGDNAGADAAVREA
jgi:tetratricopeptide (TPR) repeat protein